MSDEPEVLMWCVRDIDDEPIILMHVEQDARDTMLDGFTLWRQVVFMGKRAIWQKVT